MPYPPTSVRIRAHLWEALLCQKFLCVPCVLWESLSSHEFLLRRVWHLAIPTPPAMGYYSTEYAEFTEPPAEMSSHGFHGFAQILRVRCSPTEFTEFGSVGMAGMPYPPTSVNIRVICGRLFSARGSVYSVHSVGVSSPLVGWCSSCSGKRQSRAETAAPPGLAAWVWQGCHTLLHLCASVRSVGGSSLQEVLCIRCIPWELLHRLFGWCSSCSGKRQSRAETAAPPGGIHGSSAHISPPHHLTTTTSFHLEPSLLHVLPELWVRLRHHLRLVDAQPGEHDCRRCERHRHAVVVVCVDRL